MIGPGQHYWEGTMMETEMVCTGCGGELDLMGLMSTYKVCMGCVTARARTATTGMGCKCPAKMKRPTENTRRMLGRTETRTACERCLGVIKGWA